MSEDSRHTPDLQQVWAELSTKLQAMMENPKSSYWLRTAAQDLWEQEPETALADAILLVELLQLKVTADRLLRLGWEQVGNNPL
ncbi:MAG TPA: hypothetical protein PLE99_05780 [Candidatus Thiothrix moscowensis]|uniref:hypothetical protein n=1 Tax=unclassified Thiothrix TaxID=2636184 RepID=UPI0025D67D77|nr:MULTISPECIES: hypothetical protein [unclassified Thiothrix]HRJ52254.1 hypothetical protein [Candidatus Thiothrix moscowensis]HRJ92569.1 hypothetical protein [Candidatus Thiothrix moscowensis]